MTAIEFVFLLLMSFVALGHAELPFNGAELARNSVDITTFDDPSDFGYFGYLITDYTYKKGKTWVNPYRPQVTYDIPDQVKDNIRIKDPVDMVDYFGIYADLNEYKLAPIEPELNFDIEVAEWISTRAKRYQYAQEIYYTEKSFIAELRYKFTGFVIKFDTFILNKAFKEEISKLPPSIEFNTAVWLNLVRKYGTHYIKKIYLGGQISIMAVIANEYRHMVSTFEIERNLRTSFSELFGTPISITFPDPVSPESRALFKRYAKIDSLSWSGGYPNGFPPSDGWYDSWNKTLLSVPNSTRLKVKKISKLIENRTLRKSYELAVTMYCLKQRFAELQNAIQITNFQFDEHDQKVFNDVKWAVDQVPSDPKGVENDIKKLLSKVK